MFRWTYHTSDEISTQSYEGKVDSYGGGGYYFDLEDNLADSQAIIQDLYANLWLDRATRAVFIDFTLYNANINLFCVIKCVVYLLFLQYSYITNSVVVSYSQVNRSHKMEMTAMSGVNFR